MLPPSRSGSTRHARRCDRALIQLPPGPPAHAPRGLRESPTAACLTEALSHPRGSCVDPAVAGKEPASQTRATAAPALTSDTVEGLRRGDAAALRAVYEAYRARLYTFLLRLTRDEALARDLAQETWLRLAANARRLRPDTDPGAWLYRVARNLFVSQRRWTLVQRAGLAALRGMLGTAQPVSPLEHVAADATELRLERALSRLPLHYREVLLLVVVEGLSGPETAAVLGLDNAVVRKRLSRARAALRTLLEDGAAAAIEP